MPRINVRKDWRDSPVNKMLVLQAGGSEFDSQNPGERSLCEGMHMQSLGLTGWTAQLVSSRPVRDYLKGGDSNSEDIMRLSSDLYIHTYPPLLPHTHI